MWVDTTTGALIEGEPWDDAPAGAVWIELEDEPVEPEAAQRSDDWVPNWLAKQLLHVDADEKALKTQHALRMAAVKARRLYLEWAYLPRAEAVVKGDLKVQGGKRKSVDYAYGRCGWRTSARTVVADEYAALTWAKQHCLDAVNVKITLLKSALPKGEEVPGVFRHTETAFYVRPAVPK